ncbi:MAG: hypothetical protein ABIK99_06625 [candidate division WOR-3 bacterium]
MKSFFRFWVLFLTLFASSLLAVEEKWLYTHEPSISGTYLAQKAISRDSFLYCVGIYTPSASPQNVNVVLLRLDPLEGTKIWEVSYDPLGGRDTIRDAFIDPLGNLFLLVSSQDPAGRHHSAVVKYSPTGSLLAEDIFNGGGEDKPKAFRMSKGGFIYVAGEGFVADQNWDIFLIKYTSELETVWTRRLLREDGNDATVNMAVDSMGSAYIVGGIWQDSISCYGLTTIKYSSDGELLWTKIFEPPEEQPYEWDFACRAEVGPDGNIYVLGWASGSGDATKYDIILAKYSPEGESLFLIRCDNAHGEDFGVDMAIYRDGSVYVGGQVEDQEGDWVYWIARFYDDGRLIWKKTYQSLPYEWDYFYDMELDKNGNVYVTGWHEGFVTDNEFATVKYAKNGTRIWADRYAIPNENCEAYSLTLDGDGNIYVGGQLCDQYLGVLKYTELDIGAKEILAPKDTFLLGAKAQPKAKIKSYYGNDYLGFSAKLEVGNFYTDDGFGTVEPYGETTVVFDSVLFRDVGIWGIRSYTLLTGDEEVENDTAYGRVVVLPAWMPLTNLPIGPKNKMVKYGGALVGVGDSLVYALKGNNTVEFYCYSLKNQNWVMKESIPYGPAGKKVKKGAALCYNGDSLIYAIKGNNTREFYAYNINRNQWVAKREIPIGGGKGLKYGSSLAFAQGKVYVLKGSGTQEFYCYHPERDSWSTKTGIPLGIKNKKPKDGTSLASDGINYIYAIKGGCGELWRYSVTGDSWVERRPCPISQRTQKRRYFKSGAGITKGEGDIFFALKGGNTQEFWCYLPLLDSWQELETLPVGDSRKKVKGGGALAFANGKVFALKGNNTIEFWLYHANLPAGSGTIYLLPRGVMANFNQKGQFRLESARIFNQNFNLKLAIPIEGDVILTFYNTLGQRAKEFRLGRKKPGVYEQRFNLSLPTGVYILQAELKTKERTETTKQKLVIIK